MAANDTVQPESFSRRSFVQHTLAARATRLQPIGDAAIARAYGDERLEAEQARYLGLADLSPLARTGFKGPGVVAWLAGHGIDVPPENNTARAQADGSLAARLAPAEMLVLDDIACRSGAVGRLRTAWQQCEDTPDSSLDFIAPRQDSHAWFALVGSQGAQTLAKLCAVDLRATTFANASVAQTSVARLGAIIIRSDLGATLAYHLLVDSASADYFADCLVDAMQEFNGKPVGLAALQSLK